MDQEKIGKFISEQRKVKGITQNELAERLGVSDRAVSNWENGKNMPDYSLLPSLAKELNVTLNELFYGGKIAEEDITNITDENIRFIIRRRYRKQLILKRAVNGAIIGILVFLLIYNLFLK